MTSGSNSAPAKRAPRKSKAVSKTKSAGSRPAGARGTKVAYRDVVATAIATELAPEVAISLLAKTETSAGADEPALIPIAAGVSGATEEGKIRLRLLFENGAVLPVELGKDAGEGLIHGLQDELHPRPKKAK